MHDAVDHCFCFHNFRTAALVKLLLLVLLLLLYVVVVVFVIEEDRGVSETFVRTSSSKNDKVKDT